MKKTAISLLLLVIMNTVNNICVYAKEDRELNITSKAGIVMEQSTGRVLWGKNERERLKIASTTKILTAIVAAENANLEDMVRISKKAALVGGSEIGLVSNTDVRLKDLLYGLLLKSGNDCAIAIAEHVGGDVDTFVNMMNEKAYEIGAKDTHCANPHGLDTETNYSTAYDLAKITCYAKKIDIISKIMATESITIKAGKREKYLANTNRLLFSYTYCDGGKTGYTALAGRCLVATAKKEDLEVVAVVLGANTTDIRFSEGKKLLKYAIDNYKMVDISEEVKWYIDIPIIKGVEDSYVRKFDTNIKLPLKEGEKEQLYISQDIVPVLNAPLYKGNLLGKISLSIGNEVVYNKNIYADKYIKKNGIKEYFMLGIKSLFEMEYIF